MPARTISLSVRAYERLRRARRAPDESFSQVVLRATWPEDTVTAGELLDLLQRTPPVLSEAELDAIEGAAAADTAPEDKWTTP